MLSKRGHKSHALRLLGILLSVIASFGMVAYFINHSTEQTKKVSFKAAGVQYRDHFTEIMSFSEMPLVEKKRKNTSSSTSMQNTKSRNSTNENNSTTKPLREENSPLTRVVKQPQAVHDTVVSTDLQVLSSFDCVKSIPAVLLDYVSSMFINEYGKSHEDFHSQYETEETLLLLEKFNINCDIDQNCSALFQYDKQYGLNTTADNTFQRQGIFYCCPSAHSLTNQTISDVCKRAQTVAGKSVFRESKDSTFLGWVIEFMGQVFFLKN